MSKEIYVPEPSPTQEHEGIAQPQMLHPAIANLREHQRQLDADGCMVGVSRQAVEETLAITTELLDATKTVFFFASVVKSGEGWSPRCQRALVAARIAVAKAEGRL